MVSSIRELRKIDLRKFGRAQVEVKGKFVANLKDSDVRILIWWMVDRGLTVSIEPITNEPTISVKLVNKVYDYIQKNKRVSSSDIAKNLKISIHTVRKALRVLQERGKVKKVGLGKNTRYVAVSDKKVVDWLEE